MILLVLAFFIYGIFSPSWAARLWYNVRTFPQRMASWMSTGSEFLDYDNYKSKISSIWDKIGDKIGLGDDDTDETELDEKIDIDTDVKTIEEEKKFEEKDTENIEKTEDTQSSDDQVIKSFPKSIDFVEIPELKTENKEEKKSGNSWTLTWYSKSDLLWVINKYIEKNLDDDTDILVTVEYEDDSANPQRIILQTQQKGTWEKHSVAISWDLLDTLFGENETGNKIENINIISSGSVTNEKLDNQKEIKTQPVQKVKSTWLTQKDRKEAEEISSILF